MPKPTPKLTIDEGLVALMMRDTISAMCYQQTGHEWAIGIEYYLPSTVEKIMRTGFAHTIPSVGLVVALSTAKTLYGMRHALGYWVNQNAQRVNEPIELKAILMTEKTSLARLNLLLKLGWWVVRNVEGEDIVWVAR